MRLFPVLVGVGAAYVPRARWLRPGKRPRGAVRRTVRHGSSSAVDVDRDEAAPDAVEGADGALTTAARFDAALARRHGGLTLVLENVRKENVALIARTAEALGVASMHLVYTPDFDAQTRSFGRLSERTKALQLATISKAATNWIRVSMHETTADAVAAVRSTHDLLVATTPALAVSLYDEPSAGELDWALRSTALLFGNEVMGLTDELLAAADVRVSIPQRGLTQSLNVAQCCAMVLGEISRRRAKQPFFGLDAAERRQLAAELLPGGRPARLHNKAFIKQEKVRNRLQAQSDNVN
ncbi:Alpha/beta knot methyltransferase [Pelagophyceae sp. CCMP2097]|nr:Alpha/beta knot methyltransferase [Pelagophyceae sp. CCMP2097]